MKNRENEKLDKMVRASLKSDEKADLDLDRLLKARIHQKQQVMDEKQPGRVSLWYVPMLLNTLMFTVLGAMSLLFAENQIWSRILLGGCMYMVVTGVILTVAGIRFSNLKQSFTFERRVRV